jgi:predicted MFS family arabinose efflux permease
MTRRQTVLLVAALATAVMSFQINATMLAPAIRDIESDLGTGAYAAMSTYFYLAGAIANVVLIRWSDFVGRRRMIFGALIVLCIGTVLCIVGTSLPIVLVGRFLQGVSNVTFGLAFLIMRERLSDTTFGVCSGIVTSLTGGVAGVDGLLGGYLSDRFGYRSIFVLILGVGILGILFCAKAVPRDSGQHAPGRMDWAGGALIALGVAGINVYFAVGGHSGWMSSPALVVIVAAMVALVALVLVERRVEHPLVDVVQLRSREAWPFIVVTILNMASFMLVLGFIVPFVAEDTDSGFGMSGVMTALLFLTPAALIQLVTAPLAGRLAVRVGFVKALRAGQFGSLAVTALLAVFAHNLPTAVVLMGVFGFVYMGVTMTTMSVLGVIQAPDDEPGSLPGISNAAYGIGSSLGFAWAGPVVGSGTETSFSAALWICVAIGVVALASSLLLRPRVGSLTPEPA